MTKNILFFPDVYQEHGHWRPVITLAQRLKAQISVNVAFMGIADCRTIVESYDLEFHEIFKKEYPMGYAKTQQRYPLNEYSRLAHMWDITGGGLDVLMEDFKPDIIVSGYFTSIETLLMYYKYNKKYGTKFMFTTTFLRHPSVSPELQAIQTLTSMSEPITQKIIASVCENPVDINKPIHDFVKPLKDTIELILCPREFEYESYRFDSDIDKEKGRVKFIEPCVTPCILDNTWKKDIPLEKVGNGKIIYATAGSQVQDYRDRAHCWFVEMVRMMGLHGMQDYHLVMSVGHDLVKESWAQKDALPENVSVFPWVPQLDVLEKSAAAYVHGGLATIKECICKNVPIIVVPLGKDQMDNALRVSRSGIGQIADAETTPYKDLQHNFLLATTNNWMIKKLKKMHDLFVDMENKRPGVQLILNELGM